MTLRLPVLFLALNLWVTNGIPTLHDISGKHAVTSLVVLLTSFCCIVLLLV